MVCGGQRHFREVSSFYENIPNVYTHELVSYILIKLTNFLASAPLLILCGYFAITDAAFLHKKRGEGGKKRKMIENPANTFFLN